MKNNCKNTKMIIKGIKGVCVWTFGHLFAFFMYDKKYLVGRWFKGKMNGICATGWEWVLRDGWSRLIMGKNRNVNFPISSDCHVLYPENIYFHPDDINNFQSFGIYYQAIGTISIGHGSYIGPNVGLITSNHNCENLDQHLEPKPIVIGKNCWIGMNSVILGGVSLGDKTIVGAGSVVTKSFPEGNCLIAGNPAKKIKNLI